jgi:hypothetical protein
MTCLRIAPTTPHCSLRKSAVLALTRRSSGHTRTVGAQAAERQQAQLASRAEARYEIAMRIVIWLILGSAINFLPVVVAYFASTDSAPFASVLSSGDLLIATTAMLSPTLADLALNVKKARRSRAVIVVLGSFLSLVSVLIYGFAYTNTVNPGTFKHLSGELVEWLSVSFFLTAVLIGGICSAFLAANGDPKGAGGVNPNE